VDLCDSCVEKAEHADCDTAELEFES